ncbi:Enhancer of polycomb-like protein 1 [Hypsizygus marmoreus]|uniref:Enhancer of polycomb-like protein n=1 Tax=Hypsizygus marmoreus TaxID=39966 RepID=A0A369JLA0_HYPMA|nr:Enhancer of polycomb-like protein 1 [Hypsizygus marmoreus]
MPRNHLTGASTLRNRIRVNNKTRLKVVEGNLDFDTLVIPDEDEEKHRLTNLVAGVDAEDANEHHLQAVLSASQRSHGSNRPTRGAAGKADKEEPPAAFIPTPDSTGIVDNYEDLYPPNRWKDPSTYVCTSATVEEAVANALAGGFTYYMDERDKDWLDKNNEEARGEGTSAQGAVSATSNTRTSARSAKAKGKEPEVSQPLVISEDEFELVMGVLEKVTHEKTEYLHHGLETGMAFPAFAEYHDTFASPLSFSVFASYTVPPWIPAPAQLLRIARAIYPYWKERRIERGGHRIIPVLNGDESDTLNESYICFRRREIKAVRKTRASQASSSDKLIRLQSELACPLELAKAVLLRENQKRETAQQVQQLWQKRMAFADLKRKFPAFGDKGDEELLVDKEKPKKIETVRPAKIRNEMGTPVRQEIAMRPKDRTAQINEAIEAALNRQRDRDHSWDDQVDNPYQPPLVSYPSRLFKYVPVNFLASETDGKPIPQPRAVRARRGRGGRMLIDRRTAAPRPVVRMKRSSLYNHENQDVEMDGEEDEQMKKIEEQWRYDADDLPAVGPEGSEEQNRILVDDYQPTILRQSMTLFSEADQQSLTTDPAIPIVVDGRQHMVTPFKLGTTPMRRDGNGATRPIAPQGHPQPGVPIALPNSIHGTSLAQLKKMPPPTSVPQMRISNGGMRPPSIVASMQGPSPLSQSSPPNSASMPQHSPPNTNGISRAAINLPHVDVVKTEVSGNQALLNGAVQIPPPHQQDANSAHDTKVNVVNGSPPKQNQHPQMQLNGYHAPLSTQAAAALVNNGQFLYSANVPGHTLSLQQVQNIKSAFANMQNAQDMANSQNAAARNHSSYLLANGPGINGAANFNIQQLTAGGNFNLKLPPSRGVPWTGGSLQKANGVPNGMEAQAVNGSMSPIPGQAVPVRTPSANGIRPGMRIASNGQLTAHSMSPHVQHSPSPMSAALAQSQSPPRHSLTPTMTRASPSLQHQQPATSSKSGY